MVAARGESTEPVPLEKVAGKRKLVPLDHPWVESARRVGTCLGELMIFIGSTHVAAALAAPLGTPPR